jgi:nucleoside-diphosphate-sugar epimerase
VRLGDVFCGNRRDRVIQLRIWTSASDGANVTEIAPLIGFDRVDLNMEVRTKIATPLINEWKAGALTAMIARAADFYGPETPNGLPNVLVFEPLAKNRKASWLANDSVPHSFTYTPDAARSLVMLAENESAWNQTWHVGTTPNPPTGNEFIAMAAKELGVPPRYRVLSRPMVRLIGWFNPLVGKVYEMLYQNDSPYLFDSSMFERAFSFSGTPYAEGIRATAASFRKAAPSAR